MKTRPDVAGMAVGQGANGDMRKDRVIVVNPFNEWMKDKQKRQALIKVEAARHLMDIEDYNPDFEITPEMQIWRNRMFTKGVDPYATDDKAFKQTVISRLMVGDESPIVPENVSKIAKEFGQRLDKIDKSGELIPRGQGSIADIVMSAIHLKNKRK